MADENALIIATNKFEAWRDAKTADLLAEAHKATKHQVMRCTNCGFETTGGSTAHTNWLER